MVHNCDTFCVCKGLFLPSILSVLLPWTTVSEEGG